MTTPPNGAYNWVSTGLDWTSTSEVTLRLREVTRASTANVAVTSTPLLTSTDGSTTHTYGVGETIELSVTFTEAVTSTTNTDFVLSVSGAKRAALLSGSGTTTLVFGYTVLAEDVDANGIWIGPFDRTLVGDRNGVAQNGAITSVDTGVKVDFTHSALDTLDGHRVDGGRSIVLVAVTSTPLLTSSGAGSPDTYGADETIRFTVTFNAAVDVTGDPVYTFSLGSPGSIRNVNAAYESGSGTADLVFGYTVVSTDVDSNGIYQLGGEMDFSAVKGPVGLDSDDAIQFTGTSTDAPLPYPVRTQRSGHKVDGSQAVVSTDATLSALTMVAAGTNLLSFVPGGPTSYGNNVAYDVDEVTFTATPNHVGATIEYLDGSDRTLNDADTSDDGHQVALEVGNNNVIKVKVTAEDGVTTKTYTVTVSRAEASTDATLTDLVVNDGTTNLTLTPTFASGMYTYTARVVNAVAEVTVTPTKSDTNATIEYLDTSDMTLDDAGTDAGHQVAVAVGDTVIKVKVTAQDTTTTKTYTVTVSRAALTCTLNAGDLWCGAVTVSRFALGALQVDGFGSGGGDLSDKDFMYGTNSYTIDLVATQDGDKVLFFSLNSALTSGALAGLAVHVDGSSDTFAFGTATYVVAGGSHQYTWTGTGLSWSGSPTPTPTVRLREVVTGPAAPTNFMVRPAGDAKVALSWDAPASDSGVTRHEYQFKTDGSYGNWARIANSGVGGANQASFTASGLTNEVPHTFQLRAVNSDGDGAEAMAGPVTPTPGICDRTQQVQDAILAELSGVDDCAAVTVADLATITSIEIIRKTLLTALKSGDFAGLSALDELILRNNSLTGLPSDLFSGLTALRILNLSGNALESLPSGVFSGLTALEVLSLSSNASLGPGLPATVFSGLTSLRELYLNDIGLDTIPPGLFSGLSELTSITLDSNRLVTLPAALFSGLAKLEVLWIENNQLGTLPDGVFSGLSELTELDLDQNRLTELSGGIFSGLSKLDILRLDDNQLTSLPAGLFSGLTALTTLRLDGNPTDPLPLTMTLEKVGTGQVRAKVLAGAPSDLVLPVSVENGTLASGAAGLRVAKGSVAGDPVSVIRTEETGEVTVDLGTPLPSLPPNHSGYEYAKAASGLPVEVPDALEREPGVEGQSRLAPETVEDYANEGEGHLNGHVGRAEIFHAGRWGTVSSDGFSRSTITIVTVNEGSEVDASGNRPYTETEYANNAPALFCQAMGYDTGEYASGYGRPEVPSQPSELGMPYYRVGSTYPSDGPEPIWVDDLTCLAGDADLTGESALPAPMAHCGFAGWGLHNSNHGEDAGVRCWNEAGSAMAAVAEPLTAAFEELPEAHDGETAFSFRIAFSEAVSVTPEAMRTHVLMVGGGAVTGAARVDGESGVWAITVTPDTREDLSITLAPVSDCDADGAVCTSDGRALSVVPAHIVIGPGPETEPALTASFEGLPEAHDGEAAFNFRVAFSEEIGIGFRSMRDDSFTVDGGEVTRARRVEGRHDLWRITVEPDGEGDVTITLPAGRECGTAGAVCTRGDDPSPLTNSPLATVAGPADDAREPNTAATGTPTISGTAQVGETLTADTSGIADEDGLDNVSFSYQWLVDDTEIQSATNSTYTLADADAGKTVKVQVTFTDDAGNAESLNSDATNEVAAQPNNPATGAPTISGTVQVGEALTMDTSGIADEDGLETPPSVTSGWRMTPKSPAPPARPTPWLRPTRGKPSACG